MRIEVDFSRNAERQIKANNWSLLSIEDKILDKAAYFYRMLRGRHIKNITSIRVLVIEISDEGRVVNIDIKGQVVDAEKLLEWVLEPSYSWIYNPILQAGDFGAIIEGII